VGPGKPVGEVEATFAEALHSEPRLTTWTRSSQRELITFTSRVWSQTDMAFAIVTEERHSTNGRGGLPPSATMVAAKPEILYRFKSDRTVLEGDCPVIESTGDTGL
jgi:hypothetical protein